VVPRTAFGGLSRGLSACALVTIALPNMAMVSISRAGKIRLTGLLFIYIKGL
jgi:hypothetical protein